MSCGITKKALSAGPLRPLPWKRKPKLRRSQSRTGLRRTSTNSRSMPKSETCAVGGSESTARISGLGAGLWAGRRALGWAHGLGRNAWLEVWQHPSAQQHPYRLQIEKAASHGDGETAQKQQRAIGDVRRPRPPLHRRPHVPHYWVATLRPGPRPGPLPLLAAGLIVVLPGRLLFGCCWDE